ASPLTQLSEEISLPLPRDLFRDPLKGYLSTGRLNSIGLDLADYPQRATILQALNAAHIPVVAESTTDDIHEAMTLLSENFPVWNRKAPHDRAAILRRAADVLESRLPEFCALLIKEAFKTAGDAVAEVREAVDFLRYYADESETLQVGHKQQNCQREGRGVFVCISPWNFPLAIFTGQIAAALVTGNTVAAKPAEQTPFIAACMVELLHQAGVPAQALIMLHGAGERVGAALVAHEHCAGVCFTGSTQVAQIIHRVLASKPGPLVPLIAETGGINAMLVDSTALPEQVVDAVVHSAFRSAGQRCSALRLLCVHDSIADSVIEMLTGAMQSLQLGDPTDLATDVGPLIDDEAINNINVHISRLKREARLIYEVPRTELSSAKSATDAVDRIIAPVVFEIGQISDLGAEIFGPVLHVLRWQGEPDSLVTQINALGYGLTMGIQTRIDSRAVQLAAAAHVGNVYVNRNMIGAVVGVQPFGGEGLSGTGPKAGGPFYLRRFVTVPRSAFEPSVTEDVPVMMENDTVKSVQAVSSNIVVDTNVQARLARLQQGFTQWSAVALEQRARLISVVAKALPSDCSQILERMVAQALIDLAPHALPGPTGESNELRSRGRGVFVVLGAGATAPVLTAVVSAALLAGNAVAVVPDRSSLTVAQTLLAAMLQAGVPAATLQLLEGVDHSIVSLAPVAGVVITRADSALARVVQQQVAHRPGAILPVLAAVEACDALQIYRYATEQTLSINTAAAGGNAALLSGRHTA
ncbi:MAG: L-glutamate gamma-semialdehyde dehydrogenase, partial [Pseudohongiella sp.]|nr:L-glutamate gamma-semialdehyde dehydrogenase [Pseudohongiella sp.]